MALNEERLKNQFLQILNNPQVNNNIEVVAQKLAKAVVGEMKQGEVLGACPSGGGPLANGKMI